MKERLDYVVYVACKEPGYFVGVRVFLSRYQSVNGFATHYEGPYGGTRLEAIGNARRVLQPLLPPELRIHVSTLLDRLQRDADVCLVSDEVWTELVTFDL